MFTRYWMNRLFFFTKTLKKYRQNNDCMMQTNRTNTKKGKQTYTQTLSNDTTSFNYNTQTINKNRSFLFQ